MMWLLICADVMLVAPATGTPETGGWSTRELRTILRGLESLNLIAADIVEVAVCSFPAAICGRFVTDLCWIAGL
jgi:hypothetical protein